MAFVVETGAGLSNSNSYSSVAAADSYFADRGVTAWAALTTTAKEQALIKATDYLEQTYRESWKGFRVTSTQALSWPRSEVIVDTFPVPANIVPTPIIKACAEMAIRASEGEDLIADLGQQIIKEKVDVIETTYAEFGSLSARYPAVNRLVLPYLYSSTSDGGFTQARVVRT
jgi:hypothetical protein